MSSAGQPGSHGRRTGWLRTRTKWSRRSRSGARIVRPRWARLIRGCTGAAVVLDPSREIGPMLQAFREQDLGHQVVTLDPANAASGGFNVLDWIDPRDPLAETHVEAVVGWISGESRVPGSTTGDFFRDKARELITCLLADLLWDPDVPPEEKTLRTLRARLVTPEDAMREMLETISQQSHSPKARQLASTLKGAVKETFSGTYQNATRDTGWLSTAAYADLVSGTTFKTRDLTGGRLTVFVQIPLPRAGQHAGPRPRHHWRPAQRGLRGGRRPHGENIVPAR
jgi:type IV secretion system protein VirD4